MAKRGPKGPSKWTEKAIEEVAERLLGWITADHTNLFFKTFAFTEYGISWQSLYEACIKNDKFSETLKIAKDIQESRIAEAMLSGEIPPVAAIFTLKNMSGWRDKREDEVTHKFPTKIQIEYVDSPYVAPENIDSTT